MRPSAIALIGLVSLVLIFSGIFYLQIALLCLALLVCVPIAWGFCLHGHKPRSFWIRADNSFPRREQEMRIEGRSFNAPDIPHRLEFLVTCRNKYVLAGIALVPAGTVLACVFATDSFIKPMNPEIPLYAEFYVLCFLMVLLLFPAIMWLNESALLR